MFDVHAHVLPAMDDGPQSVEDALATLATLVAEGITDIVATPHFGEPYPVVAATEVQERVLALQRVARTAGIPVRLYAGHEVRLDARAEHALAHAEAATINDGPYVLVELSGQALPRALVAYIRRMRTVGFVPILAQPERCAEVQRAADALVPAVEAGALVQITAASLAGADGPATRATAAELVRRNLAHVFGTAIHSPGRPPRFAEGLAFAETLVGPQRVWEMVAAVPHALVDGMPVMPLHILPP